MKILFCIESLRSGGKERRLVELLKGLSSFHDIHCELVLMSSEVHYKDVFNLPVKMHYFTRKTKKDPAVFFKFYKLCRDLKPQIIHSWAPMTSFYALPAAKLMRIKLITSQITDAFSNIPYVNFAGLVTKVTLWGADFVVANSMAGLKAYNAPREKSTCIYNGFDLRRTSNLDHPSEVRKRLGIAIQYAVVMVASFSDFKDYDTYAAAAQHVLSRRDDVMFVAVGDGAHFERIKGSIKAEFKDKIKFLGKRNDVESIINACDMGILSTFTEGVSNAILEYMALGKPVIATDGGGSNEIIVQNETGFLISPQRPDMLAEKISLLLSDDKLRQTMGQNGRDRINKHFNLNQMISNTLEIYQKVLK